MADIAHAIQQTPDVLRSGLPLLGHQARVGFGCDPSEPDQELRVTPPARGLTRCEMELCKFLLQGEKDHGIADLMGISYQVVKNVLSKLFRDFGLDSTKTVTRVVFAVWLHEHRGLLGIRCQACGERN